MNSNDIKLKPKVLFLLHRPPPVHGSAVVGEQIATSEILQETFDCRVINLLASRNTSDTGKLSINKILGVLATVASVSKTVLVFRPQLCYCALTVSGLAFYRDLILVLILKLAGVPRVFHMHHRGVAKQARGIKGFLLKWIFKGSRVILLSEKLYSDVEAFVTRQQILICPNGIGAPLLEEDKQPPVSPTAIPNILFLSNLIREKGIDLLIESCDKLKREGTTFRCTIIGGDADRTRADVESELQRRGLEQQVQCVGKQYGLNKEAFLANADLFVFPTFYHNETFGLVLLEAMRHGLPCISTKLGGIPDIVLEGRTGFIVPQKDTDLLAKRMSVLLKDARLRKQMGEAGREHYERYFTAKAFEERISEILLACLN